jgi:AraC-like DNA-binding protein
MNILEYENYEEKKTHGESNFPYVTYVCSIPIDFTCVPNHWHNEFEIIYVKRGKGLISIDLDYYEVKAHDIILILPGQLHTIEQEGINVMEYENMIFSMDLLISKMDDACNTNFFMPMTKRLIQIPSILNADNCDYYDRLAECLNNIDEICKTFPKAYEFTIKSNLFQFFGILFNKIPKVSLPTMKKRKSLDKLKVIIKYVENNYANPITIEEIAALCNFSQSHFMKFFKSNMDVSFIEYLNNYRLTIASRLLISSSSSILAVAMESGFDNLSYFNRLFKKRYDMTPSEFRKMYQD